MKAGATTAIGLAVAALAVLPGSAGAAAGHTDTRTDGAVTATLTWKGEFAETRNFRIAIDRDGQRALDAPVRSENCSGRSTRFACLWPIGDHPLALRDLDGDGEPEAVVAAFTGGAHCCVLALVYRWDGAKYVRAENDFRDPGYRLLDIEHDGLYEFRTADARFGYLYGSFAESVFPIQIVRFDRGRFEDVTTDFRETVAADARRLKRTYRERVESRRRFGVRPALAAYVADLYLLDRKRKAKRELHRALVKGLLERHNRFDVGPFNRSFIHDLKRHLRRWGY
jgi:hypothetical protein